MPATVQGLNWGVNKHLPIRDRPVLGMTVTEVNMQTMALTATGVVRTNSLDFVEQVFALYDAHVPLVMLSDEAQAGNLPGITVDRCIVPVERTGWFTARHPIVDTDQIAQISYTSGTEGQPKGIVLTHANLADATRRIIDAMQMTDEIREYVGVPATYSFGLARYRAISAVGGQAYMPPRGFDPAELARMLAAGQVNALSAVPTLLRILLASPELMGDAGSQLRWMEIGSQQMTADEKRAIRAMFPKARIVQHYGLTEASRSTFLALSDVSDDQLDSVGRPIGNTEVAVDNEGRIRIRGPHVAQSRIDAEGLHTLLNAEGWLQTNDLGHLSDGYLYFDGRADDLINCGGVKIVPDQLEAVLRARLAPGAQICVARIPDADRGDGVLVAIEGDAKDTDHVRRLADSALRDMGVAAGGALQVMAVDAIPRTGTGKAQRRVLADRFTAEKDKSAQTRAKTGAITDVRSLFEHEFPGQSIGDTDTFETLGGDSLHYIKFSMAFEKRFGALPEKWETLTTADLQNRVSGSAKSSWLPLETVTLTRSFFILCILGLHSNAFIYSSNWGAAYFLIMLAGYSVARFQLPEIIRTGSVRTLLGTVRSVAIPTILVIAVLEIVTQPFDPLQLLLISNFVDPKNMEGFLFYFAEFYIQLLLLTALLFSVPRVRASFRDRPMVSALVLLISVVALDRSIESFWNTDYNYHRTPWHYAWAFVIGMVMANAKDLPSRLLALTVALIAVLIEWQLTSAAFYVGGGCVLVIFVRSIRVPAQAKMLIANIAAASMFIYLGHEVIIELIIKIFGENRPWLALTVSIVAGIMGMQIYSYLERRFFEVRKVWKEQT